ncbi:MAG: glycosyltransferase family 4 protein [Eubacteriales bacterium]|nr:glycosyltransferase family 4 protein [Eubacteriales bacterium]
MKNKKKKKILIVSQYFYPENFKGNDIAFDLQEQGFDVTVLTGIPNYPAGEYYNGYSLLKKRIETLNGVKIYRVGHIARGKNKFQLSLNYISFVVLSYFWIFFLGFKNKYNMVFIQGLSPIIQALPAIFMKRIRKTYVCLWVLDIWPDAMTSGGGISNKSILHIMNSIVTYIYRRSDKILISSRRFSESINRKGDFEKKTYYFPNWSNDFYTERKNDRMDEIQELMPKGFIIMMAGNLGKSQDLLSVLKAAKLTVKYNEIKWVFLGDGSMRQFGEEYIKANSLENTVFFLGRFPQEDMKYFYSCADVMLLTLKSDFPHLRMVVPARLQSYMSAKKAIIGMIDGGASDLIAEAKCGSSVPAGDYKGLANLAIRFSTSDLSDYANNSRKYYLKNFARKNCIENLIKLINII